MKIIKINRKRQNNGLYVVPLSCYDIDGFLPIFDNIKQMLFSAIITAVDEMYDIRFRINIIDDSKFFLILDSNKYNKSLTKFIIEYDDYLYDDGYLYSFDKYNDDDNKLKIARKIKLKRLQNV